MKARHAFGKSKCIVIPEARSVMFVMFVATTLSPIDTPRNSTMCADGHRCKTSPQSVPPQLLLTNVEVPSRRAMLMALKMTKYFTDKIDVVSMLFRVTTLTIRKFAPPDVTRSKSRNTTIEDIDGPTHRIKKIAGSIFW